MSRLPRSPVYARDQFDRKKLQSVILYACNKADRGSLGAVKLHKILYFFDMLSFARSGRSFTGETYVKQKFGPIAAHLLPALAELERVKKIEIEQVDFFGYAKREYTPTKKASSAEFSDDERRLLDHVIGFVANRTASEISEFTHHQIWEAAEMGEVLPYETVFHIFPEETTEADIEWAVQEYRRVAG